ncbi:OmpA family protein [Blattabacterium cuenoti]|uniref:OmpA/MotB domain-containing protein n=1 Tax=Blattabacterium cuenoti STAT TaxID=1457030 RepID=A0A224AK47_9FLAO|nr:OmpA family protein [Blattabacterium cuenoti]BBA17178.1 OmpA/MotB domain-containing protein [Blattabacterium cuenoti STAT]
MKNVNFFIMALFTFFSSVFSQNLKENWFIRIGAHDINYYPITTYSSSSSSPFPLHTFKDFFIKRNNSFDPSSISNIELEHKIKDHIGLHLGVSLGMVNNSRWNIYDNLFVKLSPGVNLYISPPSNNSNKNKFDPYLRLGIGYHKFNTYLNRELKISEKKYFKTNKKNFFLLDGGIGLNYWLVPNFGFNFQSTYNQVFAKQSNDYLNFWKHNIGLIFRFGDLPIRYNHKKIKTNQDFSSIPSVVPVNDEKEEVVNEKEEVVNEKEEVVNEKEEKESKICCNNDQENEEDSDHDGILDQEDLCPNQLGLKKFKGCPDSDSDNIPDHEDKCPNKFGKKENKGCPDIIFSPFLFDSGSFSLSPRSLKNISKISEIMIHTLPNSKFYINGYADANGNSNFNRVLSIKRARSVFSALVSKGVDSSRIKIRGLGVERKKGRRVEIRIRKL